MFLHLAEVQLVVRSLKYLLLRRVHHLECLSSAFDRTMKFVVAELDWMRKVTLTVAVAAQIQIASVSRLQMLTFVVIRIMMSFRWCW